MEPNQTPTYEANIPEDLTGDGAMAAELAALYFGDPMPWQPHLLDVMLARDSHDKFAAPEVGISIPRQNGKSFIVRARCLYGALNGEKILYTCHHGDTSDEMFQELSAIFEDEENDELHDLLKHVRKTNGKQAIVLKNGGLIRFTTRTDSGGRGKSFDVLILDEAQELTDSQQAALLPSISAGPKHNPQTIYLGTPP
ncbi:MAG: terminase family protein, partial [Collinsella intestinalis]